MEAIISCVSDDDKVVEMYRVEYEGTVSYNEDGNEVTLDKVKSFKRLKGSVDWR